MSSSCLKCRKDTESKNPRIVKSKNDLSNSMKFAGKMWLMIILKVTKNQVFTLSLEDTV